MAEFNPAPFPWSNPFVHFNGPSRRRPQFVWPRDGRNSSTWGRWKDVVSGKGPDIFVARGGQRPNRNSWARRPWLDPLLPDDTLPAMPWADSTRPYDFRRRRYKHDDRWTWWDARWERNRLGKERNYPTAYRCRHGDWYQMNRHPFGIEIGADAHGPQFEHWHVNPFGPDWELMEDMAMA